MNTNTSLIASYGKELSATDFTISNDAASTLGVAGVFGKVYVGTCKGEKVAIKKFYLRTLPNHLKSVFDSYCKLSVDYPHPNILGFHGVCTTPGQFAMVMECLPMNLCAFFQNFPKNDRVSATIKMRIALGVSKALMHLHSLDIRHGNIKQTTVILDADFNAKLAFHGLGKIMMEAKSSGVTSQEATIRWRDPQTFSREYSKRKEIPEYFKAADVHSLGVILWQLETREKPFQELTEREVFQAGVAGEKLLVDRKWTFSPIINKCFNSDQLSRPSAQEALRMLNKIDSTQVYLILLKNNREVFNNGAMRDIFPLIARHVQALLLTE